MRTRVLEDDTKQTTSLLLCRRCQHNDMLFRAAGEESAPLVFRATAQLPEPVPHATRSGWNVEGGWYAKKRRANQPDVECVPSAAHQVDIMTVNQDSLWENALWKIRDLPG